MSFDNEKLIFGKEHINIVEMDLDYCPLVSGVGTCTATETGDAKCYNTFDSSNEVAIYNANKTIKTYRFCESRSPHPIGLDAIPSLLSVSTSAAKIDLAGGLGVRASVSLSFKDHPSSDIGIDKYVDERSYIAFERGTFWTKFRARNPNYQFRGLRVLSGYLVDGVFDAANFTTRYYVIDKMDVTNGKATVTAKDPLKLASNKKAQAPAPSTGQLLSAITNTATSATLTPSGIGNLEYPSTGKLLIRSEVMSFTRSSDALTLTRAQNNTIATSHSSNDTVQLCLDYSGKQVDFIVNDLLVNYANIDASFIPTVAWSAEVDTFLNGLLTGIIVKPFDVFKLLKELAQSMPHYLWWDEKAQKIQLTALKAPPVSANVLNMDENIVADSFKTKDKPDLRKSTVFINFGQFDPTKSLNEIGNYQQTYARIDTDSISKYGSNEIETINSRWISNFNKAAALQLAALVGRRFSDIPREVSFSLEAKDSDIWVGQSVAMNHRDVTDFSGLPVNTTFQLLSSKESKNYDYTALEYVYGGALPEDEGGGEAGVDLVILGADVRNVNLRTEYNSLFPTPTSSTQVKFVIDNGVKVGSSSTGTFSLDTGTWPTGAIVTLQTNVNSFVVGHGGDGGGSIVGDGGDGGTSIILNNDMTLINNGVIGGGGGGGGTGLFNVGFTFTALGGGGGAGFEFSLGGISDVNGSSGTVDLGGAAGGSYGGTGGYLGAVGGNGTTNGTGIVGTGGAAGIAINKNGFTLTQTVAGDIRGAIIT